VPRLPGRPHTFWSSAEACPLHFSVHFESMSPDFLVHSYGSVTDL
jgi:hypothetical protein